MSTKKKAARRRGKHVTYFYDPLTGDLHDWQPKGAQYGQPANVSFREWEEKYQHLLYLIEDKDWTPPPVVIPSQESLEKIRKNLKKENRELEKDLDLKPSPAASEPAEEALRGVVRRVTRWEVTGAEKDLAEARSFAGYTAELFPSLAEKILAEFERASAERKKNAEEEKRETDSEAS